MKSHKHRGTRDGKDVANADDRPAGFDLKFCMLSGILRDNCARYCSVGQRRRQGALGVSLGGEFCGKSYPAGIFEEDTGNILGVFGGET